MNNYTILNEESTEFVAIWENWKKQAKSIETIDEFNNFYNHLINDYHHDYGTVCCAIGELAVAAEHRQLADWLNELKRARILLEATYDLLVKQMESGYVLNLLSETVFYDEAECDGQCLMEDIENLLEYHV